MSPVECHEFEPKPAPSFDRDAVRAHMMMLHGLARLANVDGKLVLAVFGENPDTGREAVSTIQHFKIGDVDGMTAAVLAYESYQHANVYVPFVVVRPDLPLGKKGGEADVRSVLAVVGDLDSDTGKTGALPLQAPYEIETSAGNKQVVYPFIRALSVNEAKPIAEALAAAIGCDAGTKDLCHVWRVPGTLNWPNRKKVKERGRSRAPQSVRVLKEAWHGNLTDPEKLKEAVAAHAKPNGKANGQAREDAGLDVAEIMARLGAGLRKLIAAPPMPDEDRSATLASVVTQMIHAGMSDGEIQAVIEAYPQGIGAKYVGRPDLAREIERLRAKFGNANTHVFETDQPAEWPVMDEAAYYGLAGDVVRVIAPHSEADPVALLTQFLVAFGNAVGGGPYHRVESDKHHANLYVAQIGDSAKGRKGTAWGRTSAVARVADEAWAENRVKGGLSSGEGLISEVRDPRKEWNKKDQCEEVGDPGVEDKRLLVIESEFAGVLATAERHGNTLSPVIRKAWDGGTLSTLTKNTPLMATGAHISIIGHITVDELRARLTRTDIANGFANRFLYVLVRRSKELPFGGDLSESEMLRLGEGTRQALDIARHIGRVTWTEAAANEWRRVYGPLSAGKPGLLGSVIARAEAQVLRLATLYALIDGESRISVDHLRAALAVWDYCEASAAFIFGGMLGDPLADEILRVLRQAGPNGMTRTEIRDMFSRHPSSGRIGAALNLLLQHGKARAELKPTGGRPSEVWFANEDGH